MPLGPYGIPPVAPPGPAVPPGPPGIWPLAPPGPAVPMSAQGVPSALVHGGGGGGSATATGANATAPAAAPAKNIEAISLEVMMVVYPGVPGAETRAVEHRVGAARSSATFWTRRVACSTRRVARRNDVPSCPANSDFSATIASRPSRASFVTHTITTHVTPAVASLIRTRIWVVQLRATVSLVRGH